MIINNVGRISYFSVPAIYFSPPNLAVGTGVKRSGLVLSSRTFIRPVERISQMAEFAGSMKIVE